MAGKVKIRTVSDWSIAGTIVLAVMCLVISAFGYKQYVVLRSAMQGYIECENAAQKFQDGSNMLTKQVRLAVSTGRLEYIDAYFEEAEMTKSREEAMDEIAALDCDPKAVAELEKAYHTSQDLMQREYYAMRLVEESREVDPAQWPEKLREVTLSEEDAGLSPEEKRVLAQQMVLDVEYEMAKENISEDIQNAMIAIRRATYNRQNRAADIFQDVFRKVIVCVLFFAVMMLLICLVMRYWVVSPLLLYNDKIRKGTTFPICGANELQMLAKTYNELYEENEERERLMKHQAEHDPLTQLLNRGSFDRILALYEKDQREFALILVDVDTFKSVNDTYGHAVGDAILKRVAELLKAAFRSVDYVCRIGGDEFAVIMVDMTTELSYTISDKIREVNRQLASEAGDLPKVSLSAGAAFVDREDPGKSLFADADGALYYTKEHGRNGCSFYPAE